MRKVALLNCSVTCQCNTSRCVVQNASINIVFFHHHHHLCETWMLVFIAMSHINMCQCLHLRVVVCCHESFVWLMVLQVASTSSQQVGRSSKIGRLTVSMHAHNRSAGQHQISRLASHLACSESDLHASKKDLQALTKDRRTQKRAACSQQICEFAKHMQDHWRLHDHKGS